MPYKSLWQLSNIFINVYLYICTILAFVKRLFRLCKISHLNHFFCTVDYGLMKTWPASAFFLNELENVIFVVNNQSLRACDVRACHCACLCVWVTQAFSVSLWMSCFVTSHGGICFFVIYAFLKDKVADNNLYLPYMFTCLRNTLCCKYRAYNDGCICANVKSFIIYPLEDGCLLCFVFYHLNPSPSLYAGVEHSAKIDDLQSRPRDLL